MKRKVLTSVLGAAALLGLATSSYGQGSIFFDNYDVTPYFPVVYGAGTGNLQGTAAQGDVSVELGYSIGGAAFTLIPASVTAINPSLLNGGYFQGPIAVIPGYVSGPVSFEILAWTGSTFAGAAFNTLNSPYTWTEASIPASPSPAGSFAALPGNILLTPTPEPTTLALAGLGGLASLVAFRRKQS